MPRALEANCGLLNNACVGNATIATQITVCLMFIARTSNTCNLIFTWSVAHASEHRAHVLCALYIIRPPTVSFDHDPAAIFDILKCFQHSL